MTLETKQAIVEAYKDKSKRTHDIADEFGISPSQVTKIVIEMGCEPRRPKALGKRYINAKVCPNCHTKVEIKGAKFCFNCGCDIRDEKDILVERLRKILGGINQYLPESKRKEVSEVILDTVAYMNKG